MYLPREGLLKQSPPPPQKKKTRAQKFVGDVEYLFPFKFEKKNRLSGLQSWYQKSFSHSETRAAIFIDESIGRGRWVLASCEVSSKSVVILGMSKMWKVDGQTDDGQCGSDCGHAITEGSDRVRGGGDEETGGGRGGDRRRGGRQGAGGGEAYPLSIPS